MVGFCVNALGHSAFWLPPQALDVYVGVHISFFAFPPHIFPYFSPYFFTFPPHIFSDFPCIFFQVSPAYFFIARPYIFPLPLLIFYKRCFPYAMVKKYSPKRRLNIILEAKSIFFLIYVYIFCSPGNKKYSLACWLLARWSLISTWRSARSHALLCRAARRARLALLPGHWQREPGAGGKDRGARRKALSGIFFRNKAFFGCCELITCSVRCLDQASDHRRPKASSAQRHACYPLRFCAGVCLGGGSDLRLCVGEWRVGASICLLLSSFSLLLWEPDSRRM